MTPAMGDLHNQAPHGTFIASACFFPAITKLGFDPLWFGVMIVLVAGMGGLYPKPDFL